jgi:hypothetical protein
LSIVIPSSSIGLASSIAVASSWVPVFGGAAGAAAAIGTAERLALDRVIAAFTRTTSANNPSLRERAASAALFDKADVTRRPQVP